MQLNPEGQARFRQHLQTVLRKPCSICDGINWNFDDTIFELRQFAGGPLAANGAIKPVVSITCQSCGNITFLNALTTGIVRIEAAPQPAEASAEGSAEAMSEEPEAVTEDAATK